jgi:hypothetical protein
MSESNVRRVLISGSDYSPKRDIAIAFGNFCLNGLPFHSTVSSPQFSSPLSSQLSHPPSFLHSSSPLRSYADVRPSKMTIHTLSSFFYDNFDTHMSHNSKRTAPCSTLQIPSDSLSFMWWVDASSPASLISSFSLLATRLSLPSFIPSRLQTTTSKDMFLAELALTWLGTRTGWLLIFENAEDVEWIQEWVPKGGQGFVLFLSTRLTWDGTTRVVRLDDRVPPSIGLSILQSVTVDEKSEVYQKVFDLVNGYVYPLWYIASVVRSKYMEMNEVGVCVCVCVCVKDMNYYNFYLIFFSICLIFFFPLLFFSSNFIKLI